jgi:hypothetical protein
MPSRAWAGLSCPMAPSAGFCLLWLRFDAAGVFLDACAVRRDCFFLGLPLKALTAASSILSSARLTGCAARCSCFTGLGVTARVAVCTGCVAFLTVQRAFFRGFGANIRQSSPMRSTRPREGPMILLDAGQMPVVDIPGEASGKVSWTVRWVNGSELDLMTSLEGRYR